MQAFRTIVFGMAIVAVSGNPASAQTQAPSPTRPVPQGQQPPPKPTPTPAPKPTPTPTAMPAAEPGYVETVTVVSATKAEQKLVDAPATMTRSEEHTSELQSQSNLVCRLLLENK